MKHLTLDFETYDPGLKKSGMGWAFKLNYPSYVFDLLGVALITDSGEEIYTDDWTILDKALKEHDSIICHNSTYDLGCLLLLAKEGKISYNIDDHMKYDTLVLAKLNNQNYPSYGLDNLAKFFGMGGKKSDLLHEYAWATGLYQDKMKEATGRNVHTRPSDNVLEGFCKKNMNLFPHELLGKYAIEDVRVTKKLFDKIKPRLDTVDLELYSDLQAIVVTSKARGVCIDLEKAEQVAKEFGEIAETQQNIIYSIAGHEFNIGGIQKQLAPVLIELGYDVPKTDKGNYSVSSDWLEEQKGDIIAALMTYRQANKMKKDFIDKLIQYQDAIPETDRDPKRGMLFPTMKILGATATGRFSSGGGMGCKEVNIQQIPSRNKEFGRPCRSVFIPFEGEQWGYGDFNSQESRLQVHYAKLLNCDGVDEIVWEWNTDKMMSFHDKVAALAHIARDAAKTINLGLSYGMGKGKLIDRLMLPYRQGEMLLQQYGEMVPFMNQLRDLCKNAMVENGYVKTMGGRKIILGKEKGSEKDGMNRVIQGSAADQVKRAMQRAYRAGIKILFAVHDEINFTSNTVERDLIVVQDAMEQAYKLCVPVVAEMGSGNSWLEAKEA